MRTDNDCEISGDFDRLDLERMTERREGHGMVGRRVLRYSSGARPTSVAVLSPLLTYRVRVLGNPWTRWMSS